MATVSAIWRAVAFGLVALMAFLPSVESAQGTTRQYEFNINYQNVTRLCHTKTMVAVNGQYPGPAISAREGDRVLVKVTNGLNDKNVTIHWHGIRQLRTGWYDGPAYVTQCPIQPGHTFIYNFRITGQRGTLWWHAHISWMRATVYGAIVILPKLGKPYPFKQPDREETIILGEWWNSKVEDVIGQALQSGGAPNVSDAYTINGQPGALYNCSSAGTIVIPVQSNETCLLRIINAGLNTELFFSVANHKMTLVEVDAVYTKPHETDSVLINPGQTANVLISANQPQGRYYMAARPYISAKVLFNNSTTTAILEYAGSSKAGQPAFPRLLPALNDTSFATKFTSSIRSLNSADFPAKVPKKVDRNLLFTVGLAVKPCPAGSSCTQGGHLAAAINNISFVLPKTALLQAHYFRAPRVFTTDFPDNPTFSFNFTGPQLANLQPKIGTRLSYVPYGSRVQLVLQDTSLLGTENHPLHLHGFNFFVVGQGLGNFNRSVDMQSFNLVDPPERNTIGVPAGGWVALRFRADNPGVWFMHCHLEVHTSWGLEMAFVVENGHGPHQSIIPPPHDLPSC